MAVMFVKLTAALAGMTDFEPDSTMPHMYVSDGDTIADEIRLGADAFDWCCAEFGPPGDRWGSPFEGIIRFRMENDAFAFRMRWC